MLEAVIVLSVVSVAMILAYSFLQETVNRLDDTNERLMEENRTLRAKVKLMQDMDGKWRD
ncbi:MAG: hypothetical protein II518_00255 [Candidatus Methanomethylophilus sp.]|nr:hypothetical protein [Methanomethylophilus sp.]